jgi:eukaryotic-like serine/threonine-protein kinase
MSFSDDTDRRDPTLFDGRYRIIRRLGSGGMARVMLAEDIDLHRQVAIKVLSDRYSEDAQFVERFAREARAAAGLNHPNIVAIYDRGRADGSYYIAMEYLDGETLKELITRGGPLAPRRAIDITLQLLAALRFAHRRDVVHRDVKPQNIMVLRDGRVKVTDFGIARAGNSDMTEAGSIVGTAQYLSPEQARGLHVGPESDLYSVGVVLYEMLTGRVPFAGDSAVAVAMKHVNEPPIPPRQIDPSIPPDLERIVVRAMAKDPARRYQTADEMGVDLDRVRKGAALPAATGVAGHETSEMQAGRTIIAPPPRAPQPADEPPARRTWPWLVVLLLAAVVAGITAFLLLGNSSSKNTPSTSATTAQQVPVANVEGFTKDGATTALTNQRFKAAFKDGYSQTVAQGVVISQDPAPGALATPGATVTVTISQGPQPVQLQDVTGKTFDAARSVLAGQGFIVNQQQASSDTVAQGVVISQNPAANAQAPKGSTVTLTVSTGPTQVTVPTAVGYSEGAARRRINDAGLQVATTTQSSVDIIPGRVISQNPLPGTQVAKASTVQLTISSGPPSVTVPTDLTGKTRADATTELQGLGLQVVVQTVTVTDPAQNGVVLSSSPAGGSSVKAGSTVTLQVGQLGGG